MFSLAKGFGGNISFLFSILNWEYYLNDILKKRWHTSKEVQNPLENCRFNSLPLITKVQVLHTLCDYRLDADSVPDALKVSFTLSII